MKAHIGVDAGTGYIHAVTATAANIDDLDELTKRVRADDQVVYADAGYRGVDKRREITTDDHLSTIEFRVAARKSQLAAMAAPDRAEQSRRASVRAEVEHPFLIVKRDFGFTKTRYRGILEEPEPSAHAVRLRELADALPCRCPDRVTAGRIPARNRAGRPRPATTGTRTAARRPRITPCATSTPKDRH